MLIFSGATLPLEVMPKIMQDIIKVFPLTQGIELMKSTFIGSPVNNVFIPILAMSGLSIVCITISVIFFKWE